MFKELNNYLFQHKSISLPGLGTIFLEKQSSRVDAAENKILPPSYHFRFDKYFDAPDKDFFTHLAAEKKMADYEVIKWYNEFSYDLRNKIRNEQKAVWEGVGVLKKDLEGNIFFESTEGTPAFLESIEIKNTEDPHPAQLSIQEGQDNAYYAPELAFDENEGMQDKNNWWVFAGLAAALALVILLFHFTSNGWQIQSTGNQQKVETAK